MRFEDDPFAPAPAWPLFFLTPLLVPVVFGAWVWSLISGHNPLDPRIGFCWQCEEWRDGKTCEGCKLQRGK